MLLPEAEKKTYQDLQRKLGSQWAQLFDKCKDNHRSLNHIETLIAAQHYKSLPPSVKKNLDECKRRLPTDLQ